MKTENVNIGLWCSGCFAFLIHTLKPVLITDKSATYNKKCSQCKTKSGPITIDISIWREISTSQTKADQ